VNVGTQQANNSRVLYSYPKLSTTHVKGVGDSLIKISARTLTVYGKYWVARSNSPYHLCPVGIGSMMVDEH